MAITTVTSRGQTISGTSGSSIAVTPTATIAVGRYLILCYYGAPRVAADGDNNDVTTVTDASGNSWTKVGEYSNADLGTAVGATTSVWFAKITTQLSGAVTTNLSGAVVDKCVTLEEVATDDNGDLMVHGTPVPFETPSGTNGFGSATISGLPSAQRLYYRALGKRGNVGTGNALTPSAGFTSLQATRSRNNAAAISSRAEYRINTSTGETSNPSLAFNQPTSSLFFALGAATPPDPILVALDSGSTIVAASLAPSVAATANAVVEVPVISIAFSRFNPTIIAFAPVLIEPSPDTMAIAGLLPNVSATENKWAISTLASVAVADFDPTVIASRHQFVSVPLATLAIAKFPPSVAATANRFVTSSVASVTVGSLVPTISVTDHRIVAAPVGTMSVVGVAPLVAFSVNAFVFVPSSLLTLSALVPSLAAEAHVSVSVPLGSVNVTPRSPTIALSAHRFLETSAATMLVDEYSPTVAVSNHVKVAVGTGTLVLAALAPAAFVGDAKIAVVSARATITVAKLTPNIRATQIVVPPSSSISIAVRLPAVLVGNRTDVAVSTSEIGVDSFAPNINVSDYVRVAVPVANCSIVAFAPEFQLTGHVSVLVPVKALVINASRPSLLARAGVSYYTRRRVHVRSANVSVATRTAMTDVSARSVNIVLTVIKQTVRRG